MIAYWKPSEFIFHCQMVDFYFNSKGRYFENLVYKHDVSGGE